MQQERGVWKAETQALHAVQVADRFGMEWKLFYDNKVKRVAILVSRMDHCLYDLLIRHRAGSPCQSTSCVEIQWHALMHVINLFIGSALHSWHPWCTRTLQVPVHQR